MSLKGSPLESSYFDEIEGNVPLGYYKKYYYNTEANSWKEHVNYFGANEILGPLGISLLLEAECSNPFYRILIRNGKGLKAFKYPLPPDSRSRSSLKAKTVLAYGIEKFIEELLCEANADTCSLASEKNSLIRMGTISSNHTVEDSLSSVASPVDNSESSLSEGDKEQKNSQNSLSPTRGANISRTPSKRSNHSAKREGSKLSQLQPEAIANQLEAINEPNLNDSLDQFEEGQHQTSLSIDVVRLEGNKGWNNFLQILGDVKEKNSMFNRTKSMKNVPSEGVASKESESSSKTDSPRTKEDEKRDMVIEEFIDTEENYLYNLELIEKYYMMPLYGQKPIQIAITNASNRSFFGSMSFRGGRDNFVLSSNDYKLLFADISGLINFHRQFLRDLRECKGNIGEAIIKNVDNFDKYQAYAKYYEQAVKKLKDLEEKSLTFKTFLEQARQRPECKRMSLNDLLISPIQRIPRYILLLKEIIKNLPQERKGILQEALSKITNVAQDVNESKKQFDRVLGMFELGQIIDNLPAVVIGSNRELLCKVMGNDVTGGASSGGDQKILMLLLFNDVLVMAKKRTKMQLFSNSSKKEWKFIGMHSLNDVVAKGAIRDESKGLIHLEIQSKEGQAISYKEFVLALESKEEMIQWLSNFKEAWSCLKLSEFKSQIYHRKVKEDFYFHTYDYQDYIKVPENFRKDILILYCEAGSKIEIPRSEYGAVGIICATEDGRYNFALRSQDYFSCSRPENQQFSASELQEYLFPLLARSFWLLTTCPPLENSVLQSFKVWLSNFVNVHQKGSSMISKLRRNSSFSSTQLMSKMNLRGFSVKSPSRKESIPSADSTMMDPRKGNEDFSRSIMYQKGQDASMSINFQANHHQQATPFNGGTLYETLGQSTMSVKNSFFQSRMNLASIPEDMSVFNGIFDALLMVVEQNSGTSAKGLYRPVPESCLVSAKKYTATLQAKKKINYEEYLKIKVEDVANVVRLLLARLSGSIINSEQMQQLQSITESLVLLDKPSNEILVDFKSWLNQLPPASQRIIANLFRHSYRLVHRMEGNVGYLVRIFLPLFALDYNHATVDQEKMRLRLAELIIQNVPELFGIN